MERVWRRLIAVAVVGMVLPLLAAASGAGQTLPPTPQGGGLNAVQCWAVRHCFAVGGSARGVLVDRLTGTKWSIVRAPNPVGGRGTPTLTGLSCVGSRWCMAVGTNRCGGPLAERWNGRSWSLVTVKSNVPACGDSGLTDVSCASSSFCGAEDSSVGFVAWDGAVWVGHPEPDRSGFDPIGFRALSCPARAACAEVGGDSAGNSNDAAWWNGHEWALDNLHDDGFRFGPAMTAISCPSVRFCMAVASGATDDTGDTGETVSWNGSRWGSPAYPSQITLAVAVSCASTTRCVAINATTSPTNLTGANRTSAATFNGRGWTTTPSPFDAYPAAISCPVTGWCLVVGYLLNPKTGNPVTPAAASVL